MIGDPFRDAREAARRAADKDAAAQEVLARDKRINDTKVKREQLAKPNPGYPWPKKIWEI